MDLRGSLRGFGFVDCGELVGTESDWRMYSLKWGDIVLDSERSEPGSLCVSSGEGHGSEDSGHVDLGGKDDGSNQTLGSVCRTDLGEYGELVGCEELTSKILAKDLLQAAHRIWYLEERDRKPTFGVGCWEEVRGQRVWT